MLPIEKLRAVSTIICHANCPDGLASAMILHDVLPNAEIVFVQYNTPELAALPATPGQLWCDFAPPADRYLDFLNVGAIVLDHHKTAKDVVEAFGENGIFADEKAEPGVSGALLAYHHVWQAFHANMKAENRKRWPQMETGWEYEPIVERLAVLAGIRDTWQRQSFDWAKACAQAEALLFWPQDVWLKLGIVDWDSHLAIGPTLIARQAERIKKAVKGAYRFTSHAGLRVLMFQGTSTTSDAAELLGDEVDLVVGFKYEVDSEGLKIIFSLRSHTGFDCSKFAKRQPGGGGHTGAAGFAQRLDVSLEKSGEVPQHQIMRLLDAHEDLVDKGL